MTACNCRNTSGRPAPTARPAASARGAARGWAAAALAVLRLHDYRGVATKSVRAALDRLEGEGRRRDG